jgi:hypothetical protein
MDHMDCPEPCNRLEGSSLWSELSNHEIAWPVVVHDTRGALVRENVAYNWMGAAFVVEDLNARQNTMERNFSVRVRGGGHREDFGNRGHGFFFWSTDNFIRDNVAADSQLDGFEFFGGESFTEFARNEAYANNFGLSFWYVNYTSQLYPPPFPRGTVKDFTGWHNHEYGVGLGYPSFDITFDGLVLRSSEREPYAFAWSWGDYETRAFVIQNADIQNFYIGIDTPDKPSPHLSFAPGTFTVQDSFLRNQVNIWITPGSGPGNGGAHSIHPMTITIRNVKYGDPILVRRDQPDFAGNLYLGGAPGIAVNIIQLLQVYVYDYNGQAGVNYRVYMYEQTADTVVPQSSDATGLLGSPEAGLTNAQNLAKWEWRLIAPSENLTRYSVQYRLVGTSGDPPEGFVGLTPWRPVVWAGEIAPTNVVDGKDQGIFGLLAPL